MNDHKHHISHKWSQTLTYYHKEVWLLHLFSQTLCYIYSLLVCSVWLSSTKKSFISFYWYTFNCPMSMCTLFNWPASIVTSRVCFGAFPNSKMGLLFWQKCDRETAQELSTTWQHVQSRELIHVGLWFYKGGTIDGFVVATYEDTENFSTEISPKFQSLDTTGIGGWWRGKIK